MSRRTPPTAARTASTRSTHSTAGSINCAFVRLATSVGVGQGHRHRPRRWASARTTSSRSSALTLGAFEQNTRDHGDGDGDDRQPRRAPHALRRAEDRRAPTARCSSTRPTTPATPRSTPTSPTVRRTSYATSSAGWHTGGNADVAGQTCSARPVRPTSATTRGSSARLRSWRRPSGSATGAPQVGDLGGLRR